MKMKLLSCFLIAFATVKVGYAQLFVGTGQLFIQSGAVVAVQGDLTSSTDILGPGKILLNGAANQNVNMSGFSIPNLEVNNAANVTMTGDAKIGTSLLFTAGKLLAGAFNLTLADVATASGGGTSKFVETGGTGQVKKNVTANLTSFEIPVGSGTLYSPVFLTTTGSNSGGVIGVQSKGVADPNKHIRSTDYLSRYWPITQTGIAGTLNAVGKYNDPTDIVGSETFLNGIYWNGTSWNLAGSSLDAVNNLAGATISGNGELYAMNKFVLLKSKMLLQGPYNGTVMLDGLRSGGYLPTTDPYRSSPYSSAFPPVANTVPETVGATIFNDFASNSNIVDWVYIELRDNSVGNPGATVIQSRSALVEKDGTIVDVDGVSPVYFKNIAAGNSYTIAVRHRNHLGISTNPSTFLQTLNEQTPASTLDFTLLPANQIFGPGTNYTTSGGKNLLWAGDANYNGSTKYSGSGNDRAKILVDLGGVEGAILTGYFSSDVNMNGNVKYSGSSNDRAFILSNILGGVEGSIKSQSLPQ